MNREVPDLVLIFSSALVGAVIAFLAALVTFTFHHEIRERLILRGLIVPPNEPQPANPTLRLLLEHRQQNQNEEDTARNDAEPRHIPLYVLQQPGHVPGLPVVQLPPTQNQNDQERDLRLEGFPAAWRN